MPKQYKRPLVFVGSRTDMEPLIEIAEDTGYQILGILDRFYVGKKIEGIDVIGSDLELPEHELNDFCDFFVATYFSGTTNVHNNNENTFLLRLERINLVRQAGCNLANLIHPNTEISKSAKLGKNLLLFNGVYIESHVTVGSFSQFMYHSVAAHHSVIGKNCTFLPDSGCVGHTVIGENVTIGINTRVLFSGDQPTRIGNNVVIGPGMSILKSIPDNSVVRVNGKIANNEHFTVDTHCDLIVAPSYRRLTKEN